MSHSELTADPTINSLHSGQIKSYCNISLGYCLPSTPIFGELTNILGFVVQPLEGSNKELFGIHVSRQQLEEVRDKITDHLDRSADPLPTQQISISNDLQIPKTEIVEMAESLKREAAKQLKQQTDEMSDRQNKAQALIRAITEFIEAEQTQMKDDRESKPLLNPERVTITRNPSGDWEWGASITLGSMSLGGGGHSEEEASSALNKHVERLLIYREDDRDNKLLRLNPKRVVVKENSLIALIDRQWEASIMFNGNALTGYGASEREARLDLDKRYREIIHESWR